MFGTGCWWVKRCMSWPLHSRKRATDIPRQEAVWVSDFVWTQCWRGYCPPLPRIGARFYGLLPIAYSPYVASFQSRIWIRWLRDCIVLQIDRPCGEMWMINWKGYKWKSPWMYPPLPVLGWKNWRKLTLWKSKIRNKTSDSLIWCSVG